MPSKSATFNRTLRHEVNLFKQMYLLLQELRGQSYIYENAQCLTLTISFVAQHFLSG